MLGPLPLTKPARAGVGQAGLPVLAEEVIMVVNLFCFRILAVPQKIIS